MYIYIYICMYVYICICIYIGIFMYICIYVYICVYIYVWYIYMYIYVCVYIYVWYYIYIYVYIYNIHIYVYLYVYAYIYANIPVYIHFADIFSPRWILPEEISHWESSSHCFLGWAARGSLFRIFAPAGLAPHGVQGPLFRHILWMASDSLTSQVFN